MAKSKKPKDPPIKYVNDPSLQALSDVLLWKNRNKNFIDRAVDPEGKPFIQTNTIPGMQDQGIPDYVRSTHWMAHDLDRFSGKGRVYPMMVQKSPGAELDLLNPVNAYNYADKTGEYVETPSYKLADYFSKQGYKMASDNLYGTNYKQYMKNKNGGKVPKYKKGGLVIDPKYLTYDGLPYANSGMYMDPGPKIPGLVNSIQQSGFPDRELFPLTQMPQNVYDPRAIISTSQLPPIDTNKAVPKQASNPQSNTTAPGNRNNFNIVDPLLLGAGIFNNLLGSDYNKQTVVQPQMSYNPNPYGTGSQALMENGGYMIGEDENNSPSAKNGNWIQKAVNPAHKGYCTPMTKSTCTPRRKALAKTFKKMAKNRKKEDGGIIPDPMSNFSPHKYDLGGNVNGGAKIKEVGPNYPNSDLFEQWLLYTNGGNVNGGAKVKDVNGMFPNTDLMEQWLLYNNGGNVNGGAKVREVGANYPNTDLMEQWLLYKNGGSLSADKAKEMLRDGTANGKKLTKKQKQYFGMVASGKAAVGDTMDPGRPIIPKTDRPTTNDSLALYNNTQQLLNYYRNKNYGERSGSRDDNAIRNLDKYAAEYNPNSPRTVPTKQGGAISTKLPKSQYRKDIDQNRFLQRERADEILDTRAPMALYDRRIQPTKNYSFQNFGSNDPLYGDITSFSGYDPELIKPAFLKGNKTNTTSGSAKVPQPKPVPPPPELNPVDIRGVVPTGAPNVQANIQPRTISNKSAYSATYRDPSLADKQREIYFPNREAWQGFLGTGALSNVDTSETAQGAHATGYRSGMFKNGGIMYDDGGQIGTMWGGTADLESYNPYDGGTVEFNGSSHDNGGIGMHYNGNPIEVEGGEFASRDNAGNLNIYGNMYIPGSKTKFKAAAGAIADKEKRYDFLKTKGSDLVNEANPANKFGQLKFNAGKVMMEGGQMGQQDLASKKERLASLQREMLDMASAHGLDPFEMSKGKMKKAKGGASLPFMANGGSDPGGNDPTRADRNMNPGNIKFGSFAKKYGAKRDKDGFAIFPDRKTGEKAMEDLLTGKNYKGLSVRQAISKWTDNHPYRYDLGPLTDKNVGELNRDELDIVLSTMKQGEGTRYGMTPKKVPNTPRNTPIPPTVTPRTPFNPYIVPDVPLEPGVPQTTPLNPVPPYDWLEVPKDKNRPSNVEPLGLNNIMGELYGLATNQVEPVPAQRYEPQLFTPYQVSFQDRMNANQAVFNAQARAVGASNPAALGTLGAQKYQADQQVAADEFRTNQAISNDITNKNIALVNDANLKNLGIADTQMVRQSQARSKTREFNQMILNSLSDKYAKNELENKRLAAYENLYDYRFVPTDDGGLKATYFGPNAMFNYDGRNPQASNNNSPSRTISRYDAQGNLKGWAEYDESELRDQEKMLNMEMKRRKLPLMPLQPLGK